MAKSSMVLAPAAGPGPAAGPRPTTVLRAGPPPSGSRATPAAAVLGAILLVLAVALAVVLPRVDYLPLQFQVTYAPVEHATPSQQLAFTLEGEAQRHQEVAFEVPLDNVYAIDVAVFFTDDQPWTLPDTFVVKLVGPDGLDRTTPVVLRNEPGKPVVNPQTNLASDYEGVLRSATLQVGVGPKPRDEVVATPERNATADQVEATLAARHHIDSRGTWRVLVSLQETGGCPDPSRQPPGASPQEAQDLANRAAVCRSRTAAGQPEDPGNSFTIASFSYTSFDVLAKELGT